MSKKFHALILAAVCASFAIAGCSDGKTEDTTPEERQAKFDSDLLCGFHLTFYEDVQTPIGELNKPLESGEAVASYLIREYHEESGGYNSLLGYEGADIFLMVDRNITDSAGNDSHTYAINIEETLFITNEYTGKYICAEWLFYNEETKEILHEGSLFMSGNYGIDNSQKLTADGVNEKGESYTINYEASVKFNIEYIDCLTGVKIFEYDKDNEVIKTTEFIGDGQHNNYQPGEACDYVIVEEKYADKDGEKYSHRTLINKNKNDSVILKFPYKLGIAKPTKLNIKW